ncbi:MAG: hypothetical protein IKT17_04570, partial [Lachnospiraceae bacterium]|nr:hypothetical protein [Lachnospiraceae bacterium]
LYTSTGKLTKGTDYDVDMSDAMAYGKFNVVFRLKGNYEGEIVKTVSTKARNMKNDPKLTITPGVAEYSKSGAIPDVFVNYNGLLLKEGVDYTLAYKNNVTISAKKQPTVTVKFKGYFKGSASKAFTVKKAPVTNLTLLLNDVKYSEKKKAKSYKVLPKVYDGLKQVAKKKDIDGFTIKDCTFKNAKTGALIGDTDVLEPGTMIEVTLRVSAASGGMYEGTADIKGTYRVMDPAKLIKTAKIELRKDIEYSGGNELVIKPSDLRVTLKDGYELKSNEFSIVSVTNSRFTGSSKITIRGAGDFGGTKTKSIKVKAAGL